MQQMMPMVTQSHTEKPKKSGNAQRNAPDELHALSGGSRIISQNTFESCLCASESAQRRRYDAVLETQPRTYSMEWMT